MKELSTNEWKGHIALAKFDMRAAEKKIVASTPQIPCRYDRVVDVDGKLRRVQIKYAGKKLSHATGVTSVTLKRPTDRQGTMRMYSSDEIDAIVVYVPQVDKLCWFDAKFFDKKSCLTVRYEQPKNGQTKGFNWVDDFEW